MHKTMFHFCAKPSKCCLMKYKHEQDKRTMIAGRRAETVLHVYKTHKPLVNDVAKTATLVTKMSSKQNELLMQQVNPTLQEKKSSK